MEFYPDYLDVAQLLAVDRMSVSSAGTPQRYAQGYVKFTDSQLIVPLALADMRNQRSHDRSMTTQQSSTDRSRISVDPMEREKMDSEILVETKEEAIVLNPPKGFNQCSKCKEEVHPFDFVVDPHSGEIIERFYKISADDLRKSRREVVAG